MSLDAVDRCAEWTNRFVSFSCRGPGGSHPISEIPRVFYAPWLRRHGAFSPVAFVHPQVPGDPGNPGLNLFHRSGSPPCCGHHPRHRNPVCLPRDTTEMSQFFCHPGALNHEKKSTSEQKRHRREMNKMERWLAFAGQPPVQPPTKKKKKEKNESSWLCWANQQHEFHDK